MTLHDTITIKLVSSSAHTNHTLYSSQTQPWLSLNTTGFISFLSTISFRIFILASNKTGISKLLLIQALIQSISTTLYWLMPPHTGFMHPNSIIIIYTCNHIVSSVLALWSPGLDTNCPFSKPLDFSIYLPESIYQSASITLTLKWYSSTVSSSLTNDTHTCLVSGLWWNTAAYQPTSSLPAQSTIHVSGLITTDLLYLGLSTDKIQAST